MKQILTTLVTFGALSLASATASASLPSGDIIELESRPTTTTLNARDALGMVAQCYGDSGYYRGGSRGYGYAPARRSSYYRGGGGGVNVSFGRGGYGGVPYGRSYRGYGSGYGRGYSRGYGGSGVGLFLSF